MHVRAMADHQTDPWSGSPPVPPDRGDFYDLLSLLPTEQRTLLADMRRYLESDVAPIIADHWERGEFPTAIVPALAKLNLAGSTFTGHGCAGYGELFHGLLMVELARIDPSLAIFFGGHDALGMGTIALCGSEEQKQRWLPSMARLEKIGAFALTEPDVGSDAARGLATTAHRDGDTWVLNGRKKWIGNATWSDLTVVWARDEDDGQVKGFVVERGTPGFTKEKMHGKTALRIMQNAQITLDGCRVPEADRLQDANSFADTASVLRATRLMVAWQAAGTGRGAFEHALAYATRRSQFGRPIARFQLVQDLLAGCWRTPRRPSRCACGSPSWRRRARCVKSRSRWPRCTAPPPPARTFGWAREVLGGNGVLLDHHVTRYTNDAEAIYSFEGTREINALIVGRALTGISAFV